MGGFAAPIVVSQIPPTIPRTLPNLSTYSQNNSFFLPRSPFTKTRNPRRKFAIFVKFENELKEQRDKENNGNNGGEDELKRDLQALIDLKWKDLLYPDSDNLVAVGLTGLLTWASVQVLWQLLVISIAILVAALKYSFVAALLLFILITLL